MFCDKFGLNNNVECGLINCSSNAYSRNAPVPLKSVKVKAHMLGPVAQVELTQVYVNHESTTIEAIYYFPLDSNGSVTNFCAELEGRIIKSEVKPKEEAIQDYNNAISNQQTAVLLESSKPDILKVKVGFLTPGSMIKIVIEYVTEVKNEKGSNSLRFFLPTTIVPRYAPANDTRFSLQEMTFSGNSSSPLDIKLNVRIQGGIKSIKSPTHNISLTDSPQKLDGWSNALVELVGRTTDMDKDFVVLIQPDEQHKPVVYSSTYNGSMALACHLIPSFELKDQKVEIIFLVDRSGSMEGESIELAKQALMLLIHSLPVDCYFNIISFGTTYEFLFSQGSVKYNEHVLQYALRRVTEMQSNFGGTEILQSLQSVYSTPVIPGYLRQLFVLTDGAVSNTDNVISLIQSKAHECRVYSLGIGHSASHYLVNGMAEAGYGSSAFVNQNESFDAKILQQLKNAIQPSLTDVVVEWDGHAVSNNEHLKSGPKYVEVNKERTLLGYGKPISCLGSQPIKPRKVYQVPEKVPPICDGSQLLLFGLFDEKRLQTLKICAQSPDGPLTIEINLADLSDVGHDGMIHKLAAAKLIKELEMKLISLENYYTMSMLESFKQEIIDLSLLYGITSKYTSFIAVDEKKNSYTCCIQNMQSRNIPSQLGNIRRLLNNRPLQQFPMQLNNVLRPPGLCLAQQQQQQQMMSPMQLNHGMAQQQGNHMSMLLHQQQLWSQQQIRSTIGPQVHQFGFQKSIEHLTNSSTNVFHSGMREGNWLKSLTTSGTSNPTSSTGDTNFMPTTSVKRKLYQIISFQSFVGYFPLSENLAKVLGTNSTEIKQEIKGFGKPWNKLQFTTAIAIAFLKEKLSPEKDSWELLVLKAEKWLRGNLHEESYNEIMVAATNFVKNKIV